MEKNRSLFLLQQTMDLLPLYCIYQIMVLQMQGQSN
jgi:hypothetical protein